MVQLAASYCVMLLVMYSNGMYVKPSKVLKLICPGYIILSIVLGGFVGFSLFTKDMLGPRGRKNG